MNHEKYKLLSQIAGVITALFFICFFKYTSHSVRMIIGSIFLTLSSIIFILNMIGRKKLKSKWILPGAICAFLLGLVDFLNEYFQYKNIDNKKIILILGMLILIIFIQIAFRYQLSILKDKNEIKKIKRKRVLCTCLFSILETLMIYGAFIYHQ